MKPRWLRLDRLRLRRVAAAIRLATRQDLILAYPRTGQFLPSDAASQVSNCMQCRPGFGQFRADDASTSLAHDRPLPLRSLSEGGSVKFYEKLNSSGLFL